MKEGRWKLYGNLNVAVVVAFWIIIIILKIIGVIFFFSCSGWQLQKKKDFYPKHIQPKPSWEVKLTSIHHPPPCLSSLSSLFPPDQGRWESIGNQGNGWKIIWSWNVPDWTFTSKGTSEKGREMDTLVTRTLKPGSCGCEATNWGQKEDAGCSYRG